MHHVHCVTAPQYLTDAVQSVISASSRSGLRSANTAKYVKRCTRTKFGERGFSFSGPAAWTRLPSDLQHYSDTDGFKKKLKTFLFQLALINFSLPTFFCFNQFLVFVFC